MPNTETGMTTWEKLTLIAKRAREERQCQFTSLAHLLDKEYLRECYQRLGHKRAGGVDGVSWKQYGEQLDENLRELVGRLKAKRYKPQPAKRVYIPKDDHSKRPLGLPCLEDKIVQKGMVLILEAIYEEDFEGCSYGFRPGRSAHQAINGADKAIMTKPINHIVDADIKGFFDNVVHEWMMKFLRVRMGDPNFLRIIERFLKAGYLEEGLLHATEKGTPQGGNLSPMLANIYLHYVLDLWFEKKLKREVQGQCELVRYADDFICMVQRQEDAQHILEAIRERFAKFGLELHPEKTRVISFGRYEPQNAKRQERKAHTFDFLGFTHYCGKSRKGNFIVGRKTSRKKFRKRCRELKAWLKGIRNQAAVRDWWPILGAKLRGHYQYYGISGNSRSIRQYYCIAVQGARKWLNRRSQRKPYNWERFVEYLKRYPLPKPRIVHNLYTLAPVL